MTRTSRVWGQVAAMAAATAIGAAACDSVPLLAPSGSSLVVQAGASVLAPGAATGLSATVIESAGTPVPDGTTVYFTTTLGTVDPASAQTVGGVARTTFRAGSSSGVARIRASSGLAGSAAGENATTGEVEVSVGAAAIGSLTVSANPGRVAFGGGTSAIVATARGENGEELSNILVDFSSDEGTLSSASALTDATGRATTQLATDRTTVVTAAVGGQSATVTVTGTSVSTLTLGVNPGFVFGSGGTVQVIARVLDSQGVGLSGVPVFFSSATATVTRRENTVTNVVITATAGTEVPGRGQPYTFAVSVTPTADSQQVTRYEWTFGDGKTLTNQSGTTSHVFTADGVYTVTVEVFLQDGRDASGQTQVIVDGI